MPAEQRTGLVTALRAFSEAGGELPADEAVREAAPLGWA
jgi:hypothetical protein